MKRFLSLLLVLLMVFSTLVLVSCNAFDDDDEDKEPVELSEGSFLEIWNEFVENVNNDEYTSFRVKVKDENGKESVLAQDYTKTRKKLYFKDSLEFWVVNNNEDCYWVIEKDGSYEKQGITESEFEQGDSIVGSSIRKSLTLESLSIEDEILDKFVSATRTGDTIEAEFEDEEKEITLKLTLEDGRLVKAVYNENENQLTITYEYDININVPEAK